MIFSYSNCLFYFSYFDSFFIISSFQFLFNFDTNAPLHFAVASDVYFSYSIHFLSFYHHYLWEIWFLLRIPIYLMYYFAIYNLYFDIQFDFDLFNYKIVWNHSKLNLFFQKLVANFYFSSQSLFEKFDFFLLIYLVL